MNEKKRKSMTGIGKKFFPSGSSFDKRPITKSVGA